MRSEERKPHDLLDPPLAPSPRSPVLFYPVSLFLCFPVSISLERATGFEPTAARGLARIGVCSLRPKRPYGSRGGSLGLPRTAANARSSLPFSRRAYAVSHPSNPFSLAPFFPCLSVSLFPCFHLIGAGDGIRTRDPQLGRLMLYQLSYTRLNKG